VNAVYEVCSKLLKPPKRKCQYWFDYKDPHIETLLDQRRALCKDYLKRKTERSKIRFKNAKIKVRSALRQMENKFWENKCKEMQYFAEMGKHINCTKQSIKHMVLNTVKILHRHF